MTYEDSGGLSQDDVTNLRIKTVKKVIAEEMYNCYDQFYAGNLPFFLEQTKCVICAEIDFEQDWVKGIIPEIENFGRFLRTENTTQQKDITYAQFLGGSIEDGLGVDTRVKTKIVFTATARSWFDKFLEKTYIGCGTGAAVGTVVPGLGTIAVGAKGCLIGGIVGLATSESTFVPILAIGPSASVTSSCDRVYQVKC